MKLKAGTYRFNNEINIDSDITCAINFTAPLLTEAIGEDISFIGIETINEVWNDNGDLVVGSAGLCYEIGENNKFVAHCISELNGWSGWLSSWYTSVGMNLTDEMLQTHTITQDTDVDDTFGTWYIANTNYNEVNSTEVTFDSIKAKMQVLIDKSNAKTGKNDTDLYSAFESLLSLI